MYRSLFCPCHSHPRQSPIDIVTRNLVIDKKKCQPQSLRIKSRTNDSFLLTVSPDGGWNVHAEKESNTFLEASHLPGRYKFLQFHAHWSSTSECGSEHTVDGNACAGEIHFVFWNTTYSSQDQAQRMPDGLAVVGVFLEEGDFNHHLDPITSMITEGLHVERDISLSKKIDISRIIPIGSDYITYDGSLTTPGYNECVVWTVMMQHIQLSANQLFHFRQICAENWRQTQDLAGRKVYASNYLQNNNRKDA